MSYNQKELKSVFNRVGGALLVFLALYSALLSPATMIQELLVARYPHSATVYIITDLICSLCYVASFVLPVAFFYLISKTAKKQPMALKLTLAREHTLSSTLAIVFLGTAVCLACAYLNSMLFPISESAYDQIESSIDGGYQLVLMFISTAIVPAFVEEFLFRGMVLSNLRPYSEGGAILVSALTFGLMHQTPFQIFYTTAVGVVFGYVCVKTESIWSGVLLHFFNNFFAVIQTYLLEVLDVERGNAIYNIMMLSVMLLATVFGAIFSIVSAKKPKGRYEDMGVYGDGATAVLGARCDQAPPRAFFKAFLSPTMIVFIVLCVTSIVSTAALLWFV